MAIRHWPQTEQPRFKLLNNGPHSLSDAELIAIFLGSGYSGHSAVDMARDMLVEAQGLRPLLEQNRKTMLKTKGLGEAKWVLLQAALELGHRYLEAEVRSKPVLCNPDKTKTYVKAWLCRFPHEVFACLFLDNRHRIINNEILFTGTIDGASVYPREVVKRCLELNAAAIIFAHNHPSGIAEPSQADRQITVKLTQALALLDVRVLDHLVVGDKVVTSMAERGLM